MAATTIPSPHCWDMFLYTVPTISMTLPSNRKLEKKKNLICVVQNFETFFGQILTNKNCHIESTVGFS